MISDIRQFSIQGFAEKYFAIHKKGFIFKKTIPVEDLLMFQKNNINKPLMVRTKEFKSDAIKCFKTIQKVKL